MQMISLMPISRALNAVTIKSKDSCNNPFQVLDHQLKDIIPIPTTYKQAYYCGDIWCKGKWRKSIDIELNKMKVLQNWQPINYSDFPPERKPIKNKWVF
jgi:hypothetical protein